MASKPEFGLYHVFENFQSLIPTVAEMSTAALVVTAPNAQAGIEINEPYRINATDSAFYTALGEGGTARDAIRTLNSQQKDAATDLVIVVAAEGATEAETVANVRGDIALKTGMQALRRAPVKLGVTPRLLSLPGYTSSAAHTAVVDDLPGLLDYLTAVAFIGAPNAGRQETIDWREGLPSHKRLIPAETHAYVTDPDGSPVLVDAAPALVGKQVAVDTGKGGFPFHAIANRQLFGLRDPGREIDFDLRDGDTEGQILLAAGVGFIEAGQIGVDGAIADGGLTIIATDTTSEDEEEEHYNVVRGRDWIELTQLKTLRDFLGKYNLTGHTMVAFAQTVEDILRAVRNEGHIAGFEVSLPAARNAATALADGELTTVFRAQPFPIFKRGRLIHKPYRAALTTTLEAARRRLDDGVALAGGFSG